MEPRMNMIRRAVRWGSPSRIVAIFAIVAMFGTGFVAGYVLGRGQPAAITHPGLSTVQFRYDENTGWFEVWENGILRSEFTATELGIEHVADPQDWQP